MTNESQEAMPDQPLTPEQMAEDYVIEQYWYAYRCNNGIADRAETRNAYLAGYRAAQSQPPDIQPEGVGLSDEEWTKEVAGLLDDLDEIARHHGVHEYGLPLHDYGVGGARDKLIGAVESLLSRRVAAERERAAKIAEPTTAQILLAAGEMTASEKRTVRAVLAWIASAIRATGARE